MNISYPTIFDDDFNLKLLEHEEFNELQDDFDKTNKDLIKIKILSKDLIPFNYQLFVSRFFSSFTPYRGLFLFHSPGSGKSITVILTLKQNYDYIVNLNSKIYICVPSKLLKRQWLDYVNQYIPDLLDFINIITYRKLSLNYEKMNFEKSILILDEVHNLTKNEMTNVIINIKENNNIKILALSATPIKNRNNEIIDVLNFILEEKIYEKDYFKQEKDEGKMILYNKEGLFKKMIGHVSTVLINNSEYLANKINIGTSEYGLKIIKTINIKASKIQNIILNKVKLDQLGIRFELISSMIFPINFDNKKNLFSFGIKGYEDMINNIDNVNKMKIFNKKRSQLIYKDNEYIFGSLFDIEIMRMLSPKNVFVLKLIENLPPGNIFIYSKFQVTCLQILRIMLINDGYEDYSNKNLGNKNNKRCLFCNNRYSDHEKSNHLFVPISFFILDKNSDIEILKVFNDPNNIDGKLIKIILGSKSINEGISLMNVLYVIKVDSIQTLAREEQVIRRAIRINSHKDYYIKFNRLPNVYVFNLALITSKGSQEINNYILAEKKYKDTKIIEDLIKEASIDKNVYEDKIKVQVKNTFTKSLIKKNTSTRKAIEYIVLILKSRSIVLLDDLIKILNSEYDNLIIILALDYLKKNNKIFINKIDNKFYCISSINENIIQINYNDFNILKYYENKINIKHNIEKKYIYDDDYNLSREYHDLFGVLSENDKLKLKFSNKLIKDLKLNITRNNYDDKLTRYNIYRGWICSQSISKEDIKKIVKYLNLNIVKDQKQRSEICDSILNYLIEKEKNTEDKHYLIIPINHDILPFPLCIKDRIEFLILDLENRGYTIISKDKNKILYKDKDNKEIILNI